MAAIDRLRNEINKAIAADKGQYPWFTRSKLENALKTLNQAEKKLEIATFKLSKKSGGPLAEAFPWGKKITVHEPFWDSIRHGTVKDRAATLVHEAIHLGTGTTDGFHTYFWTEAPHDVLFIGWDSIASTYDTWIRRGFSVPGSK